MEWKAQVTLLLTDFCYAFLDTALRTGDFHWYRLDNNGRWSHKPGETQASQLDNANAPIGDPRNCALGAYVFARFMIADPLTNQIGGNLVCTV